MAEPLEVFMLTLGPLGANCFSRHDSEQALVGRSGRRGRAGHRRLRPSSGSAPAGRSWSRTGISTTSARSTAAGASDTTRRCTSAPRDAAADGRPGSGAELAEASRSQPVKRDGRHSERRAGARSASCRSRPFPRRATRRARTRSPSRAPVRRRSDLLRQRRPHRPARRLLRRAAQLDRRSWCGGSRPTPRCTAGTAPTPRWAASSPSIRS